MILYKGKVFDSNFSKELVKHIKDEINHTREKKKLSIDKVIDALVKLGKSIEDGEFQEETEKAKREGQERYLETVILSLKRENIEYKIRTELGNLSEGLMEAPLDQKKIKKRIFPLGTLLHIAAGNSDVIPVYSVMEGLLTGNVNILKLPKADDGLSIRILQKLIEMEPEISDFVYVFDTPSKDTDTLMKLSEIADGIVVWGGDEAVKAVRRFSEPGVRLIEWGHKLGFCYITDYREREDALRGLAEHIAYTRQLLCSSCQVIFLDTEDMEDLRVFAEVLSKYLDEALEKCPDLPQHILAENSLKKYSDLMDGILRDENNAVIYGKRCALEIKKDSSLELSPMYGRCLVKRLPKNRIFSEIRNSRRYLQTAGLICREEEKEYLIDILASCGVTRVMDASEMSSSFVGESHDGDYALSRYVRTVDIYSGK